MTNISLRLLNNKKILLSFVGILLALCTYATVYILYFNAPKYVTNKFIGFIEHKNYDKAYELLYCKDL